MHTPTLVSTLSLLLAAPLQAQFPLQGFLYNWDRPAAGDGISGVVRWNINAEENMVRIDRRDHPEWGVTPTGQTQVQGFMLWLQDDNDTTVETFRIVGYQESTTQPDFPDLTTPVMNIGPIPMPPTGTPAGGVAYRMSGTLVTPVTFAGNLDVFVGVGLNAMTSGTPPFDGLWVATVSVDPFWAPSTVDTPGPRGLPGAIGGIPQGSYTCYVPTGQPARYVTGGLALEQLAIDVHVSSGVAGATPIAVTPQTSFPASNVLGTTNFISGLHPDVARGDNIGLSLTTHTAHVAAPCLGLVLLTFGPSPIGPLPVTAIGGVDPASVGNVCVDFTNAQQTFIVMNAGQANSEPGMVEGQFVYPISAAERAIVASLPSLDIWWQGFAIEIGPAGFEVRASGCSVQHLK